MINPKYRQRSTSTGIEAKTTEYEKVKTVTMNTLNVKCPMLIISVFTQGYRNQG